MLAYAKLHPGKGFDPLRAALYYSQRLAVSPSARQIAARCIGAAINFAHPSEDHQLTDGDRNAVDLLVRDGVVCLGSILTTSEVDRLTTYLAPKPVVTSSGATCQLADIPESTAQASYPLRAILECDAVSALANNPHILAVARHYLGCTPTISSIGIRWSFCGGIQATGTQTFHRDVDDWRFLKLFVYLSDVDDASGPHEYVKGSHHIRSALRGNSYSDVDIETRFEAYIEAIKGTRGTAFFADTYGIHRGRPPQQRPRLILQVQYSILPVYAFAYEPLEIPSALPVDDYINRLLVKPSRF